MKRNELLRKTGICFTALALSFVISSSGSASAVYAADFCGGIGTGGFESLTGGSMFDSGSGMEEGWTEEYAGGMGYGDRDNNSGSSIRGDGQAPGIITAPVLGVDSTYDPSTNSGEDGSGFGDTTAAPVMPPPTGNGDEDDSGTDTKDDNESNSGENSGEGSSTDQQNDDTSDDNDGDDGDDSSQNSSTGNNGSDDAGSDNAGSGDSKTGDSESGNDKTDDSGSGNNQNSGSGSGNKQTDDSGSGKNNSGGSGSGAGQSDGSGTGNNKSGGNKSTGDSESDSDNSEGPSDNAPGYRVRKPSFFDNLPDQNQNIPDDSDTSDGPSPIVVPPNPVMPDMSENITYAPGTSGVPIGTPAADPFVPAAPLSEIDPTVPASPTAAQHPYVSQGNPWGISLDGVETVLDPGELPGGYSLTSNYTGSNEQLIAAQNIISGLSIFNDGFRFYTIDKDLGIAPVSQSVFEEMDNSSRAIGSLLENDALYVLSEENDGWLYVESGNVRGFIPSEDVLRGTDADSALDAYQVNVGQASAGSGQDRYMHFATELVPASENGAFTYKRCTTKTTVVDKKYAIADADLSIREGTSDEAREIGNLPTGGLCYVLLQADAKWAYVESGNVRGFTPIAGLTTGNAAQKIVQRNGEGTMTKAVQLVSPADNAALYYTLNSVQEGTPINPVRTEIIQTAAKCIGNPYKWGGNSLTGGCDCSGFVKQLYALYGYDLPRVADDQSRFGTQIPLGDAAPGDLIFFASNGYVYHVALYAGDGKTIEAFSSDRGIIATTIGNRDAVWATRVLPD